MSSPSSDLAPVFGKGHTNPEVTSDDPEVKSNDSVKTCFGSCDPEVDLDLEPGCFGSSVSVRSCSDFGIPPLELDPFRVSVKGEELSEAYAKKAYAELQEKAQWRQRDIQALREIVQNSEVVSCPLDDEFLLRFLRVQKFDYDRAFTMLQRYLLLRKNYPRNFEKALPSLSKPVFDQKRQTILPHRDAYGRRVYISKCAVWNPSENSLADCFASDLLCLEMIAREPKTQVAGLVVILDMTGLGFTHISNISLSDVKVMADTIQNTFPVRFREIHVLNESYLVDIVYTLMKPFLSETIKSRIHFHGANLDKLHEIVSPQILPEEFGGDMGPMNNTDLVEIIMQLEEEFKDLGGLLDFSGDADTISNSHPFQGYCMTNETN